MVRPGLIAVILGACALSCSARLDLGSRPDGGGADGAVDDADVTLDARPDGDADSPEPEADVVEDASVDSGEDASLDADLDVPPLGALCVLESEQVSDRVCLACPDVEWTGSHYGLFWVDARAGAREVYLARRPPEGVFEQAAVSSRPGIQYDVDAAWTGSEYGAVWSEGTEESSDVFFGRVSADGALVGDPTRVSDSAAPSLHPAIVWADTELGVAWEDEATGRPDMTFARLSPDGSVLSVQSDAPICSDGARWAALAYGGGAYGLGAEGENIFGGNVTCFVRRAPSGEWGTPVYLRYEGQGSHRPDVAWSGRAFVVAWGGVANPTDLRFGDEVFFSNIDASGDFEASTERITNARGYSMLPAVAPTGDGYGLAFHDERSGDYEILFVTLDRLGRPTDLPLNVTSTDDDAFCSAIAFTGSEFGVAWLEETASAWHLHFARIGPCDV